MANPVITAPWSRWPAPAKLNLFLRILNRRNDGYHNLQTVFRLLDWGDEILIRLRQDGQICQEDDESHHISADENIALRAAHWLLSESNCRLGADIRVIKRIPSSGGFGGGSSDAATVLHALNCLWALNWPIDRLASTAVAIGADVPVFVTGCSAWAEGVGDLLQPITLPEAWYLVVDSGCKLSTAELFSDMELTRDAAPATIADFVSGTGLENAFESVARNREPTLDRVLSAMSELGKARLTGTGGGCFIEFSDEISALAARTALQNVAQSWVVRGLNRSPLLDAVAEFRKQV